MTKHNFETLKTRLILGLTILCLLFTCLFGLTACKNDKAISDPTYSNTQTTEDDGKIKNATFAIGSDKTDDDAFPITSATGWTRAADNSATSSTVNSGIVKTTADSWKKTVKTLYADADFANYIENKSGKSKDEIKTAIKADKGENYTVTDDDVAEYVAENLYKNPAKHADNADDYVYMLNNFRDKTHFEFGTAQKLTSSSTLTLEKGKNYKITVWVKTANIAGFGNGANIRLTNSFGGVSQAEVAIDNIKVTEWTEYTLYVKASNDYDCSATLVLGLGYGDGSSTTGANYNEGTVYFDDVTLTEIEDSSTVPATTANGTLEFGKTDRKTLTASSENVYVYDMNANLGTTALSTLTLTHKRTESNVEGSSGKYTHGTYSYDGSSGEVTLDKSSVTLSLTSDDFKVNNEEYFYLSFYVKNTLNKFGSTAFTVDVWDIPATGEKVKRAAVYTSSEVSEDWTRVDILVKNNFVADTTITPTPVDTKTFSVDIVIGPTAVSADVKNADYASGTISFKDFTYKTGKTDKEDYVTTEYTNGTDNPEYKIYDSLFTAKANATVALYAGSVADYTAKEETTNYAFTYAPGDIGTIQTHAADVNGYYGVTAKHEYVYNGNDAETKTNLRSGEGTADGIAGLINTKYLPTYATNFGTDIETQLGDYGDEDIQAIMIYNKNAGHYGFIGTSKTVSASAYAKVSVTLKVNDDAKAYVYLVDIASNDNQVMKFENFTVNTEASGNKNAKIENKKLAFEGVGKTDGFVTLTFYVAAGASEKTFRVEVWNGGRDGEETSKSAGFVFVKDITVTTSSAFTEPTRYADAFSSSSSPLFGVNPATAEIAAYVRELTSTEKAFNKEYPDQAVSYSATYVWARTDDVIYAVYNTLDPVENDPYANVDDEEETSGCAAETDPSTFWLSFSSILLGVVLVLAIIALLVKTMRRRHIANRNDAKTQYKVKSRIETHKENQKRNAKRAEEQADEIAEAEDVPETVEEEPETEKPEQNLDDYVYGDVQDFGDAETNEEKPENSDDKTE